MVTPRDYLDVAIDLIRPSNPSEAACRTAASRAYYAVFHFVREALGVDPDKAAGGSHSVVRQALFSPLPSGAPAGLGIARPHWDTLFKARVDADYRLAPAFDIARAKIAIARAEEIFSA